MHQRSFHVSCWIFGFCFAVIQQTTFAFQLGQETILIPPIAAAKIDAQESDSIDFVLPAGKGKSSIKDWLAKFQRAGWAIEVVDQDSMSAEYEITRNGRKLEIELDDPGIDEAEITISCDSRFRLAIEGAASLEAATPVASATPAKEIRGLVISPAEFKAPSQANGKVQTLYHWIPLFNP